MHVAEVLEKSYQHKYVYRKAKRTQDCRLLDGRLMIATVLRSQVSIDCLPTLKTGNNKIFLMLPSGECGLLRIADAERAQVHTCLTDSRQYAPYACSFASA